MWTEQNEWMNEWKTDRRTDGRTYEHIKWIIVERGLYCAVRVVTKYSLLYKGLWRIGKSNHDDDDLLEISLYYALFGYIHGGRCCNIYYRIIQIKLNSFTQTTQFFFGFCFGVQLNNQSIYPNDVQHIRSSSDIIRLCWQAAEPQYPQAVD